LAYPALVRYGDSDQYRLHYERVYCRKTIETFDGIEVTFRKSQFAHCFFESSKRDGRKDVFSMKRAERIDWLRAALQDVNSERYVGWDKKRKRYDTSRRVTIVMGNYVVVIRLKGKKRADFLTAYVADTKPKAGQKSTIEKIRESPKWT